MNDCEEGVVVVVVLHRVVEVEGVVVVFEGYWQAARGFQRLTNSVEVDAECFLG